MEKVSFTVDAGIINRLGLELVAKSETAVAELIKNAYDADANVVKLYFENAKRAGGKLIIDDDGVGMDKVNLINGFMRLATTDKIHNSISDIYKRPKAGRKGIGRFSTQRLGKKLKIITQTELENIAWKLTINWDDYETDLEITEIKNELDSIKKDLQKISGTKLIINKLRDSWSEADIKRVYRYVSELIQPNLLKVADNGNIIEESKKEGFEVEFYAKNDNEEDWVKIADPQVMLLNRALVTFTGYIDDYGIGHCNIKSKAFNFNGIKKKLEDDIVIKYNEQPFTSLKGTKIAFKIYYFIGGDRNLYYGITRSELKIILDHLDKNGGVKLYRNGFRVPKYGDIDNDWLSIDKNSRIGKGVPFNNNRLLGFVQLVDAEGKVFEESAGREGLIEKDAFYQLQNFATSAILTGFSNFTSWFKTTDEYKTANPDKKTTSTTSSIKQIAEDLKDATKTLSDPDSTDEEKTQAAILIETSTKKIINETNAAINELEMLRVLAGVGLTIAEFIHEIKQFVPSLTGYINDLLSRKLSKEVNNDLMKMKDVLNSFISYTSYFDTTISQNIFRELRPIDIRRVLETFLEVVNPDINRRNIQFLTDLRGFDLITLPMHPSEWNTIFQNLYSNAKKAILRSNINSGKILIKSYKEKTEGMLILEFLDNGDGIPKKYTERIFDAFFTTSNPSAQNHSLNQENGSGLGLYILSQMIKNRNGKIKVIEPIEGFNTCIQIKIPLANNKELEKYGY